MSNTLYYVHATDFREDLPREIKIRLGDPLICCKPIKTVIRFPINNFRNSGSMFRAVQLELARHGMSHGQTKLNMPIATHKRFVSRSWDHLTEKDSKNITGVILSEDFENTDIYLVLFSY